MQRIRTLAELDVQIQLTTYIPFLYQTLAARAQELFNLGLNFIEIGRALGVTDKTAKKALQWINRTA